MMAERTGGCNFLSAKLKTKFFSKLVSALVVLAICLFADSDPFVRLENRTIDLRFAIRPARKPKSKIVLVTIQSSTERQWDEPASFRGIRYATLIQRLQKAGAAVIGLDVLIPTDVDVFLEKHFAFMPNAPLKSVLKNPEGKVVIATSLQDSDRLANSILAVMNGRTGNVALPSSQDGYVREAILYTQTDTGDISPGFSSLLAKMYSDPSFIQLSALRSNESLEDKASRLKSMKASLARMVPESFDQPNGDLTYLINYCGKKPDEAFKTILAEELEAAETDDELSKLDVRGAAVIIGTGSEITSDVHSGLGGKQFPGCEIHAHALSTLLDREFILKGNRFTDQLITAAASCVFLFFAHKISIGKGWILLVVSLGLWWMMNFLLFSSFNLMSPIVVPTCCILFSWSGMIGARAIEEQFKRLEVEKEFGKRISPQIRDVLLSAREKNELLGFESIVTVMFCDVRDSTDRVFNLSPKVAMSSLNRLFEAIVPPIEKKDGLVFSYIGDGFMAVFGAPVHFQDHAQLAFEAALLILEAVDKLNESEPAPWRIGLGIHTGTVFCGNLGAPDRMEFTIIGDTVNVASRLEGKNREIRERNKFDCRLIVSKETRIRLNETARLSPLETMEIRGRSELQACWLLPDDNRQEGN